MEFDDLFAYGQADPRARIAGSVMEALEQHEDAHQMPWIDADAVVVDRNDPLVINTLGGDLDPRRIRRSELDGIADEILKES